MANGNLILRVYRLLLHNY